MGWLCCPCIVGTLSGNQAHVQLVRESSATVISAHWATVDWSWPKEWNWCMLPYLHFNNNEKRWWRMICPTLLKNPCMWATSHQQLCNLLICIWYICCTVQLFTFMCWCAVCPGTCSCTVCAVTVLLVVWFAQLILLVCSEFALLVHLDKTS